MNFENQDILKNVKLLNADKVQGQGEMKNEKKKTQHIQYPPYSCCSIFVPGYLKIFCESFG